MGTSINIGTYGQFTTSRIAKVINCKNKNEAFKMGWLDKFKDLFRGDNKKIDRLERLWSSIHTEDNNTSRLFKSTTIQLGNFKPGTNLYRIEAFKRLENLINDPAYKFTVAVDNNKLQFIINDNPIMESIPISETEATPNFNLYQGMKEESPSNCSLRTQLNLINYECDEDFELEEIQSLPALFTQDKSSNFLQKNSLLPDHASRLSHSVIKYFDGITQEHCLLIKPKTKNTKIGSNYVAGGANKIIKTSALRVVFDPNSNEILALTRNVTCSSLREGGTSTKVKDTLLKEEQKMAGFTLVQFDDGKKERAIYTMEYKGEAIWRSLCASPRPNYLTGAAQKFGVIDNIMAKFDPSFGDIKAENTTLQYVFDGETYALDANFIDHFEQTYTYKPNKYIELSGDLRNHDDSNVILMHQLYNLSLMFYLMFEDGLTSSEKIRGATASVPTDQTRAVVAPLNESQSLAPYINKNNPFAQLLLDTYECKIVNLEEFKQRLNGIKEPRRLAIIKA